MDTGDIEIIRPGSGGYIKRQGGEGNLLLTGIGRAPYKVIFPVKLELPERGLYEENPVSLGALSVHADFYHGVRKFVMDPDKLAGKQQLFQSLH
jgi:hypothetical protein